MPSVVVSKKSQRAPSGWSKMVPKSKADKDEERQKATDERQKRLAQLQHAKRTSSKKESTPDEQHKQKPAVAKKPSMELTDDSSSESDETDATRKEDARREAEELAAKELQQKKRQEFQRRKREEENEKKQQEIQRKKRQEESEKKQREVDARKRGKALKNPNTTTGANGIQKVAKLSALLARGGPEADAYRKSLVDKALATWNNNSDRWEIVEHSFEGSAVSETKEEEQFVGSLSEATERFNQNPEKYLAVIYSSAADQDEDDQRATFILREGTTGYSPESLREGSNGSFTILQHRYKRLEPLPKDILPRNARDKYTDNFAFQGKKLHNRNKPILPGRGMGIGDTANMKFIGNFAEPNDIFQGSEVGNCWLLSAIASLADYDWAVRRLFRKTQSFPSCPFDTPNQYTITLWDLKTWKEVDIIVDERLPVRAGNSGFLLGAKPSRTGMLWVPYLEKAIAAHCGGWDKLQGGACTAAWPMLTGSRNQYMITRDAATGKYMCSARFNTTQQRWTEHSNSPHDSDQSVWRVSWPKVGGGGSPKLELTRERLFRKLVAWNDNNFLIGAGTDGSSDRNTTNGIVDNHAYSVIECKHNICGSGIDLLLIRNPWGRGGDIKNGQFNRFGNGWDRYPDIKAELNPVLEDNGLFWVTQKEFFDHFPTIYLCAFNMTRLKDKNYTNDLKDDIEREAPKKQPSRQSQQVDDEAYVPLVINKKSDPNSPYKIVEQTYNGQVSFAKCNKKVIKGNSLVEGVAKFRANPEKYLAIHYQTDIATQGWPQKMHQFTYILRDGTKDIEVEGVARNGNRTILMNVRR